MYVESKQVFEVVLPGIKGKVTMLYEAEINVIEYSLFAAKAIQDPRGTVQEILDSNPKLVETVNTILEVTDPGMDITVESLLDEYFPEVEDVPAEDILIMEEGMPDPDETDLGPM